MRRSILALFILLCSVASTAAFAQLGPPSGMIYADDRLFRTIGTPTELPATGTFNTIYQLGGDLASVAQYAPGQKGFAGGRWEVRDVTFVTIAPTQFTNVTDLLAAESAGQISIGPVIKRFECPLIRVTSP
jgi:hypothetical protein